MRVYQRKILSVGKQLDRFKWTTRKSCATAANSNNIITANAKLYAIFQINYQLCTGDSSLQQVVQ